MLLRLSLSLYFLPISHTGLSLSFCNFYVTYISDLIFYRIVILPIVRAQTLKFAKSLAFRDKSDFSTVITSLDDVENI